MGKRSRGGKRSEHSGGMGQESERKENERKRKENRRIKIIERLQWEEWAKYLGQKGKDIGYR